MSSIQGKDGVTLTTPDGFRMTLQSVVREREKAAFKKQAAVRLLENGTDLVLAGGVSLPSLSPRTRGFGVLVGFTFALRVTAWCISPDRGWWCALPGVTHLGFARNTIDGGRVDQAFGETRSAENARIGKSWKRRDDHVQTTNRFRQEAKQVPASLYKLLTLPTKRSV